MSSRVTGLRGKTMNEEWSKVSLTLFMPHHRGKIWLNQFQHSTDPACISHHGHAPFSKLFQHWRPHGKLGIWLRPCLSELFPVVESALLSIPYGN